MRDAARLAFMVGMILALFANSAYGQQRSLTGVVLDSVGRAAIPGAVVTVIGRDGQALSRSLSDQLGRFTIELPSDGVAMRAVRIGFSPAVTLLSADRASFGGVIELSPLPTFLEAVRTAEAPECPLRSDRERALGLWQQARAALLASVTAEDQRPAKIELVKFRRAYAHNGTLLVDQQVQRYVLTSYQPFEALHKPSEFARLGYSLPRGAAREFDAPDAQVMLDDSFAATHCFSIATDDGRNAGEIGLRFEPAGNRNGVVDVRGVLWVGRHPARLDSLEFEYTGLLEPLSGRAAGGFMTFQTLANGVVFVDHWEILAPDPPAVTFPSSSPELRYDIGARNREHRSKITGGQVVNARWNDGLQWAATLGSIRGRVIEGVSQAKGPDRVWLRGTTDTTSTDSTGAFAFLSVLPGMYAVGAANSRLAAAGVSQVVGPDSADAFGQAGQQLQLRLALPQATFRSVCHVAVHDPLPSGILFVRVVNIEGWVDGPDSVYATWQEPSRSFLGLTMARHGEFGDTTGVDGRVAVCNPPRDKAIQLLVGSATAPDTMLTVRLPAQAPIGLVTVRLTSSSKH